MSRLSRRLSWDVRNQDIRVLTEVGPVSTSMSCWEFPSNSKICFHVSSHCYDCVFTQCVLVNHNLYCAGIAYSVLFVVKNIFPYRHPVAINVKTGTPPFGILANHKMKMCHNKKIMIQKITQNNWNFWTVNLIMRAKKLLTSRQISGTPYRLVPSQKKQWAYCCTCTGIVAKSDMLIYSLYKQYIVDCTSVMCLDNYTLTMSQSQTF